MIPIGLIVAALPPLIDGITRIIESIKQSSEATEELKLKLDAALERLDETNRAVQSLPIHDV